MAQKLIDLPWLPMAPDDWLERARQISPEAPDAGADLRALASFRLDASKSTTLRRAAVKLRNAGNTLAPLSPFKLGIIAANTFDLVLDCLPAAAMRHGVALETLQASYGMIMQPVLDPTSPVYTSKLDAILIVVDHRWLGLDTPAPDLSEPSAVDGALAQIESLLATLRDSGGPPAIVQTLALPLSNLFGNFDAAIAGTVRSQVGRFNSEVVTLAAKYGAYVLDVAGLAAQVGADDWFNPVQWAAYKLAFDARAAPIYAEWLCRLLGAIRGKSAKCLVLDLDNTLWGGVIGDDGMEGIIIGQGNPRGEAHLAVQRVAQNLRARGIFLAVCSKNEAAIAIEPFRSHPDMLLREQDISVFQANWIDKATNLEAIAKALNIGLDALVLLDDNPAERAQVRKELPMVRVPEVPDDPSWFAWTLEAGGWFEAVTYSAEDAGRVKMQAQDVRRAELMADARDLTEYLRGLDMTISFKPFDAQGRQRIVQLINKTNQFNLTTRRYTESQVSEMEANPSVLTLQVRLTDRFGDLGMIAVIIGRPHSERGAVLDIDNWLMSCRVLGRQVETATLSVIAAKAKEMKIASLVGTYIPTDKNRLVENHYGTLGFVKSASGPDGKTFWELDLATYQPLAFPMSLAVD